LGLVPKLGALKGIDHDRMPCKGEVSLSLKERIEEPIALVSEF
jgi:hypothetical protein